MIVVDASVAIKWFVTGEPLVDEAQQVLGAIERDLPEEVARKPGYIAAAVDKRIDRIAHLPGPVFVVAHDYGDAVGFQAAGIAVQVVLGEKVETETFFLSPAREGVVESCPAAVAIVAAVIVGEGPFQPGIAGHASRRQSGRVCSGSQFPQGSRDAVEKPGRIATLCVASE